MSITTIELVKEPGREKPLLKECTVVQENIILDRSYFYSLESILNRYRKVAINQCTGNSAFVACKKISMNKCHFNSLKMPV